jgi:hypothetical protein
MEMELKIFQIIDTLLLKWIEKKEKKLIYKKLTL